MRIAPRFPASGNVSRAAPVPKKTVARVELGLTCDFQENVFPSRCQLHWHLGDRIPSPEVIGKRTGRSVVLIEHGCIVGYKQAGKWFSDNLCVSKTKSLLRIFGKIDDPAQMIGCPEPSEACVLKAIQKLDTANIIGFGYRDQRCGIR